MSSNVIFLFRHLFFYFSQTDDLARLSSLSWNGLFHNSSELQTFLTMSFQCLKLQFLSLGLIFNKLVIPVLVELVHFFMMGCLNFMLFFLKPNHQLIPPLFLKLNLQLSQSFFDGLCLHVFPYFLAGLLLGEEHFPEQRNVVHCLFEVALDGGEDACAAHCVFFALHVVYNEYIIDYGSILNLIQLANRVEKAGKGGKKGGMIGVGFVMINGSIIFEQFKRKSATIIAKQPHSFIYSFISPIVLQNCTFLYSALLNLVKPPYNQQLPTRLIMHKELPSRSLAQSYIKSASHLPPSVPYTNQSFYQPRPSTNYIHYEPERMNHSYVAPNRTQAPSQFKIDSLPYKLQEQPTNNFSRLGSQEYFRVHTAQSETGNSSMKAMEQRMRDVESRIDRMEKQDRKAESIVRNVEEIKSLQLKDIQFNEELEERLVLVEEMMAYLKDNKADRTQVHSVELQKGQMRIEEELNELWRQQDARKDEVRETRDRLQRLVSKIETTMITVGEKYEEFIERNIIKSIENVNKLANLYHEEIETFRKEQMGLKEKLETIVNERLSQEPKHKCDKNTKAFVQMLGVSIPNLILCQSLSITGRKSTEPSKDHLPSFSGPSPKMSCSKINLMGYLYDSIDKSTEQSSTELLLQKTTYKLDREYYLLDDKDHYLLDNNECRIQLSPQHIALLHENGLIE